MDIVLQAITNSGVYSIRCSVTDKEYIGSALNPKRRYQKHLSLLRREKHPNRKLQGAWQKYGEAVFVFTVIEYVPDRNLLICREQFYLDTLKPAFNINPTAESWLGRKHTQNTKTKIGDHHRGKKMPLDAVERMKKALIGNKNATGNRGNRGRKHSSRACKNMSEAHTGYVMPETQKTNISTALRGRKISAGTRRRMSEARKQWWRNQGRHHQ